METTEKPSAVFVYGSNLKGRHGRGAARVAYKHFGAKYGIGVGRCGMSYGIPTKDYSLKVLPVSVIKLHVDNFLKYAAEHPEEPFIVTRIGCGEAGYKDDDIAPLFKEAPSNCILSKEWRKYYERNEDGNHKKTVVRTYQCMDLFDQR